MKGCAKSMEFIGGLTHGTIKLIEAVEFLTASACNNEDVPYKSIYIKKILDISKKYALYT